MRVRREKNEKNRGKEGGREKCREEGRENKGRRKGKKEERREREKGKEGGIRVLREEKEKRIFFIPFPPSLPTTKNLGFSGS